MLKKIVSVMVLLILTFAQVTFSESLSKVDYSKRLVKGLGFEVKSAQSAYKRDTTESEDVIYTAFQLGLLNGVSWDFENPMTDEEREIILANAMVIFNASSNGEAAEETPYKNETVTPSENIVKDSMVESNESPDYSEINFVTEWGTIKTPSNLNPNEGIWTDEEFHKILTENREEYYDIIKINLRDDYIGQWDYQRQDWFYDPDLRHFIVKYEYLGINELGQHENKYVDVDEKTNGRMFQTMKVLFYQSRQNKMDLSIVADKGRVWFYVNAIDRGIDNLRFFVVYEDTALDYAYNKVDGYDSTNHPIKTEWVFNKLFDWEYFAELGYDIRQLSTAEGLKVQQSFGYTEQHFNDFVYGVCDALYSDDAMNIYLELMASHLKDRTSYDLYNIETNEMITIETDSHFIYKHDPIGRIISYGIADK